MPEAVEDLMDRRLCTGPSVVPGLGGCCCWISLSATRQVLVLAETVMMDFREDVRAKIGHLSGPRLQLRDGGRALQQAFADEVEGYFLQPATHLPP